MGLIGLIGPIPAMAAEPAPGRHYEPIKYGDMENWVTRHITESVVIGGKQREVYAIAPTQIVDGNDPYKPMGNSPWATSNVYAKVSGITKASNAVFPHIRVAGDTCAKLCTQLETVKVLGLINMKVLVTGTIFLGEMLEPISGTKDPLKKMVMGIPYSKRPSCLKLDYMVDVPLGNTRIKSSGFGGRKTIEGRDSAVVFVMLQRRWETPDGRVHAKRVATGGEVFGESVPWQKDHEIPLIYGDCSQSEELKWLDLRNGERAYCTRNSHGKIVPIEEEGWDDPGAQPTHVIVLMSSGNDEPYVGTLGLTLYVDNIAFGF